MWVISSRSFIVFVGGLLSGRNHDGVYPFLTSGGGSGGGVLAFSPTLTQPLSSSQQQRRRQNSLVRQTSSKRYSPMMMMVPPELSSLSLSVMEIEGVRQSLSLSSSSLDVSLITSDRLGEALKVVFGALLFGGGLIPAAISANKAMFNKLSSTRPSDSAGDNPETSLDPTAGQEVTYVSDSGATGPELPNSALLLANERIPLVDVIAIAGRLDGTNVNAVADWRNLPSAKMPDLSDPDNPPMWLPRATFKANVRQAKFKSWPLDSASGQPVGGDDLRRAEEARVSKRDAVIGDAALDAFFDTWAWGSGVATPDKVQTQLDDWLSSSGTLNVGKFVGAAQRGRAVTVVAAASFVIIQILAYGTLFVAPGLRVFFDVDIGFGTAGSCGPSGCIRLADLFAGL